MNSSFLKAAVLLLGAASIAVAAAGKEEGFSWQKPQAKVLPTGDLAWDPEPFQFEKGASVRYIDFENGNDSNPGDSKEKPWKHHPWDANAQANARECKGVQTYVFKRGSIYRGKLIAQESGESGDPIRLTSDPAWGQGDAAIQGSVLLAGGWQKCTAATAPKHMPSPEKVWYQKVDFMPRGLWLVNGEKVERIHVARIPNFSLSNWSDPMQDCFESSGDPAEALKRTGCEAVLKEDPARLDNAVLWTEWRGNMGTLHSRASALNKEHTGLATDLKGMRYWLENMPHLLDAGGEFFYETEGKLAGNLYLRLPGDADPNKARIEASKIFTPVEIHGQHDIVISGLRFSFDDAGNRCNKSMWPHTKIYPASIRLVGDCRDIRIDHNKFYNVGSALIGFTRFGSTEGNEKYFSEAEGFGEIWRKPVPNRGEILQRIAFTDNDIASCDRRAVSLEAFGGPLQEIWILRNNISNVGGRPGPVSYENIPAISLSPVDTAEIAGNMIEKCYGCGIVTFGGKSSGDAPREKPLIRILIHHNKASYVLLDSNDWGGIAPWQGGPTYTFNNVCGHASGPKHNLFPEADPNAPEFKGYNTWACNAYTYYLDGSFKQYVFNNIAWGLRNDPKVWLRDRAGGMMVIGHLNCWFNNTFSKFMIGMNGSSGQRCVFGGNAFNDISELAFAQDAQGDISLAGGGIDSAKTVSFQKIGTLSYTRNQFYNVGKIGGPGGNASTIEEARAYLQKNGAMVADVGSVSDKPLFQDATKLDFRPTPDSALRNRGVKLFVPWALYMTVGEWSFTRFSGNPEVVLGENFFMSDEYLERHMYKEIPRNDLHVPGATAADYVAGNLENWIDGSALKFNGRDRYAVLSHSEATSDWSFVQRPAKGEREGKPFVYPGEKRRTVDMGTNNFLVECYFRTEPGHKGGVLVSKMKQAGYEMSVGDDGAAQVEIRSEKGTATVSGGKVNDGRWHHVLADVDRGARKLVLYVDGRQAAATVMNVSETDSLANDGDFLVGKAGGNQRFFAGAVDFLRVCRGTLADAKTNIEELYAWQFDGWAQRDFLGRLPSDGKRDAGALEITEKETASR